MLEEAIKWGIAMGLFMISLVGCTSSQAIRGMEAANALIDLKMSYEAASIALQEEAEKMPEADRKRLLALKLRADRLVLEITRAWAENKGLAVAEASNWVEEARDIYAEGKQLIMPRIEDLDASTIVRLGELDRNMRKIDEALQDFESTSSGQYIKLLMQATTTALRIAALRG